MAETELSVLARQCLDRRIPDAEVLNKEVAAWEKARNAGVVKVDWSSPPPTIDRMLENMKRQKW